jgi:phosphoglycolate phosphatase-like HAD superfamily hydrolase
MRISGARRALVALYHPRQEQTALGRLLARLGKVVPLVPVPVAEGVILLSFSPRARKPSPWGLQWLARGRPAVFYGDEDTDRLAAEAAGAEFVLVQGEY